MAMSGVALDSECKLVYDEVQSKKKHRYVTFKIVEDKAIKVDKVRKSRNYESFCQHFYIQLLFFQIGTRESTYDEFLTDLCAKDGEADDCRYAIYDFEFVVQSAGAEASNR